MTEQVKQEVLIHLYLSYRSKAPKHLEARDSLKRHCDEQGIKLIYDETSVQQGDNLIAFMDDLAAARCVFLFLSPDYFQSAYTLFELVSIHEHGDLERRFIFPLRVSDDMVTYQWTMAKQYWDENEAIRNELVRLLKCSDFDAAWRRVTAAWDGIVFPYLDELHHSLEQGDIDGMMYESVTAARKSVNDVVEEEKQRLRDKIKPEITAILKNKFIPTEKLKREFRLPVDVSDDAIVGHLLEENKVGCAIANLTKVIQDQKERLLPDQSSQWEDCHHDAEQLCGWLLINSIDPVWWFNQQLRMNRAFGKSITNHYSLAYPPYVEVIISRSLLQNAQYQLDDMGRARPACKHHDAFIFDGFSNGATDIELLAPIYKDLFKSATVLPGQYEQMLQAIMTRAKSYLNVRNGKPIYYVVGQTTLQMLQSRDWFFEAQAELVGYLHFVCCDVKPKNDESSPCREDQELLLDQLALLLSMRK